MRKSPFLAWEWSDTFQCQLDTLGTLWEYVLGRWSVSRIEWGELCCRFYANSLGLWRSLPCRRPEWSCRTHSLLYKLLWRLYQSLFSCAQFRERRSLGRKRKERREWRRGSSTSHWVGSCVPLGSRGGIRLEDQEEESRCEVFSVGVTSFWMNCNLL